MDEDEEESELSDVEGQEGGVQGPDENEEQNIDQEQVQAPPEGKTPFF